MLSKTSSFTALGSISSVAPYALTYMISGYTLRKTLADMLKSVYTKEGLIPESRRIWVFTYGRPPSDTELKAMLNTFVYDLYERDLRDNLASIVAEELVNELEEDRSKKRRW